MNKAHLEAIAKIKDLVSGVKTELSESLFTAHEAKDGSKFHVEGELKDGAKILIGENFEAAKTPEDGKFELADGSEINIKAGLIEVKLAEGDEEKPADEVKEEAKEEMAEGDEEKIAELEARVQAVEEILKQIMESVEPEEEVVEELAEKPKENIENDFSDALSEIKKQLDETKEVVTKLAGLPAVDSPRAKRNVIGQTREDIQSKKDNVLESFNRVRK